MKKESFKEWLEKNRISGLEAICLGIAALGTAIIIIETVVAAILRS
jgi:hypothetical protein